MFNGKRVLVTGGNGFIGSEIVRQLTENGAKSIRVLDNTYSDKHQNNPIVEMVIASIESEHVCDFCCQDIDIICHQAAIASVPFSVQEPEKTHHVNVGGFSNILESARKAGIKRIVYASSSAIYGSESRNASVESDPPNLLSPYALSKYVNEKYAELYTRLYGMECIGLRYFNVYGPGQDAASPNALAIPKFIDCAIRGENIRIYGDGSSTRDFVYVSDVARANLVAMVTCNPTFYGRVVNVGSGQSYSIKSIAETIVRLTHSTSEIVMVSDRVGDMKHSLANIYLAIDFGFLAKTDLETGIKNTINAALVN